MSSSGFQINVIEPKNDKEIDSKIQKFESDVKEDHRVSYRDNFSEYLFYSTLHGLRYVGDRTISRLERAFFVFMFFVVVLLSGYFISNVYEKWLLSPVIVTLNSKSTSVQEIPFPAVTICNMNQVRSSVVKNIPIDSAEYGVIMALCRLDETYLGNGTTNRKGGSWGIYREMLTKVTPSCDMLLYCEYGGVEFNCSSRFSTILTDDGFCCIFNGVPREYLMKTVSKDIETDELELVDDSINRENMWTPEKGYSSEEFKSNEEKYPLPGVGPGNELGLSLILNADIDDYFCSSTHSFGFKVLLHSPNDLPRVAHYGIAIPTEFESRIAVTPTYSIASKTIRRLGIDARKCIFESENFLSFYSAYSERNCQSECGTKLLYEHCKCILFYQPMISKNISICGPDDVDCIVWVIQKMRSENSSFKCDQCISSCFSLNYESSFSMAKIFDRVPLLWKMRLNPKNVAILHTYYNHNTFRAHKKEALFGFTDFLSNMGGLLSLFMGFSLFSIIELFYFLTIRPYCNYLRFSNRRDQISKLFRKMIKSQQKKHSRIIIQTVQSNSNIDYTYHQRYLD